MQNHLTNIEIKDFKCFKDFKADGFKRVNLIGGKNNVGKTAFMEACFLTTSKWYVDLYEKLLEIETHRNIINNLKKDSKDLKDLIKNNNSIEIFSDNTEVIDNNKNRKKYILIQEDNEKGNITINASDTIIGKNIKYNKFDYSSILNKLNMEIEDTRYKFSIKFITQYSNDNEILNDMISEAKTEDKYNLLNQYLQKLFGIENIDVLYGKAVLKVDGKYLDFFQFGQGIKTFISVINSLLLLNNDIIFIDEIENGIHYTQLDEFWELILTISEEQNVQVFATTHSKECIESFARVSEELKDDDISFISLYKDEENNLKSITLNNQEIIDRIELGLDNR